MAKILGCTSKMDSGSKEHLDKCRIESGVADMVGYGLHCGGVPHSWDREEGCEVFSINLPGLAPPFQNLRIPLLSLPHSCFGPNTWDDVMEEIAWSCRFMWHGVNPEKDLRGAVFTNPSRRKKAGTALRYHACVVEMRGDWKMLAETFHLPRWNEVGGICWDCPCTVAEVARAFCT